MNSGDNRPGSPPRQPPRVFVAYTHDSERHKQQVLQFCTFLRTQGIDAQLDRWYAASRQDWYTWAIQQMTEADFAVVVASPGLKKVADGGAPATENRRAQSEASILRELLHANREAWLPKLLPVLLPGYTPDDIPLFLQPRTADHYRVTGFSPAGAEDLLRALTEQPGHPLPALGPQTALPSVTQDRHNTQLDDNPVGEPIEKPPPSSRDHRSPAPPSSTSTTADSLLRRLTQRKRLALLAAAVVGAGGTGALVTIIDNPPLAPDGHSATNPSSASVSSGAAERTSASSDQYLTVVQNRRLSFPDGRWCSESQRIDLDSQQVAPEVDGADVWFFPCEPTVFQADSGAEAFAMGSAGLPTPQLCVDLARTQPSGPVLVETFEAGKTTFCVITHRKAVGWLRYTGKQDKKWTFELTLWQKRQ